MHRALSLAVLAAAACSSNPPLVPQAPVEERITDLFDGRLEFWARCHGPGTPHRMEREWGQYRKQVRIEVSFSQPPGAGGQFTIRIEDRNRKPVFEKTFGSGGAGPGVYDSEIGEGGLWKCTLAWKSFPCTDLSVRIAPRVLE